ncbi:MAG: sodium transport system permease protein [Gammaproteobacteria bacterium]|jgi:sodium transport system permease protein
MILAVMACELRQLVRDGKALFAAVVLPALLLPLMFLGQDSLENLSRKTLAAREVQIVLDLESGQRGVVERFRDLLAERAPILLSEVDAGPLAERNQAATPLSSEEVREQVERIFSAGAELLVTAESVPLGDADAAPLGTRFHLYFDVKDDSGREARQRAQACLDELAESLELERRGELLGIDPALGLSFDVVDVASEAEASGAALGRMLPLFAIFILIAAGSYTALAAFAGERESGTLETLLVQPVPVATIAWGKYLAVLVTGLVALACNLASLQVCISLNIGSLPGLGDSSGLDFGRLLAGLVYLPGCVLVCALVCLVCGRARTFREGQMTILPALLFALVPTAIASQPELEMDLLLAAIPLTGPALALRDALRGQLSLGPVLMMFASHALWCWLLLSRLASILDAEKVLSSGNTKAELHQRRTVSRRALHFGFGSVLATYMIGGTLQGKSLFWGMTAQFWVLLPLIIWACTRGMSRLSGKSSSAVLGLCAPKPLHLIGSLCLIPGLAWLAANFGAWQQSVLPLPQGALDNPALVEAITGFGLWKLLFLMAISPAIWEELLFRGAVLFGFRHDLGRTRALLLQAALFAAAHASVYRLAPTFVIGLLLGDLRLRTRSLWPPMLLHAGYNGLLVLGMSGRIEALGVESWPAWLPWLGIPGLALLALSPYRSPDPVSRANTNA